MSFDPMEEAAKSYNNLTPEERREFFKRINSKAEELGMDLEEFMKFQRSLTFVAKFIRHNEADHVREVTALVQERAEELGAHTLDGAVAHDQVTKESELIAEAIEKLQEYKEEVKE